MAALTTVPDSVDLTGYAGDTLTVAVTVSDASFTAGCTWTGNIQADAGAAVPDMAWTITPDGSGGATLELTAAQTRALVDLAPATASTRAGGGGQQYAGVYDVQVARTGFTRTLIKGTLTIVLDVTKP